MEEQMTKKHEIGMTNATNVKEKQVLIQGSKSISELCTRAGLTAFESQSKIICDVCNHDDLTNEASRNLGHFDYDMFKFGDNFENKSESRKFKNLKSIIVRHVESRNHMDMSKELEEKQNQFIMNEAYNTKVGMGRTRQIYENVIFKI